MYECPSCGTRYLGEQPCPDRGRFCRRVGTGRGGTSALGEAQGRLSASPATAACPHCDEPVAVSDLVADEGRRCKPATTAENEPETNDRAKRAGRGGHTRAPEPTIPTRQSQRSENENLDRLTYQGEPFPIIKLANPDRRTQAARLTTKRPRYTIP